MSEIGVDYSDTIPVIREAVLDYIQKMLTVRAKFEQSIREKTEDIKQKFVSQGQSTYSYAEINRLTSSFKEFYINFYKNTIHLKIVKESASAIKKSIYESFVKLDVISQEILDDIRSLKEQNKGTNDLILNQNKQIEELQELKDKLGKESTELKKELSEVKEEYENIMNTANETNVDTSRLEDQLDSITEEMLETKRKNAEIQVRQREKDAEILRLKSENAGKKEIEKEVRNLREKIHEMELREKELIANQSASSEEFINKLQEDLEKTRDELYKKKSEEVKKNEQLRTIKLSFDESKLELKYIKATEEQSNKLIADLRVENEHITKEKKQTGEEALVLRNSNEEHVKELSTLRLNLNEVNQAFKISEEKVSDFNEKVPVQEGTIEAYEKSIDYFKSLLLGDIKFRALTILESLESEISLKDLSSSLGVPTEIALKYVIELSNLSFVITRRQGQQLYIKAIEKNRSPFSLLNIIKIAK